MEEKLREGLSLTSSLEWGFGRYIAEFSQKDTAGNDEIPALKNCEAR